MVSHPLPGQRASQTWSNWLKVKPAAVKAYWIPAPQVPPVSSAVRTVTIPPAQVRTAGNVESVKKAPELMTNIFWVVKAREGEGKRRRLIHNVINAV